MHFFGNIEAKNIPAVTPIWIDGGHVGIKFPLANKRLKTTITFIIWIV